MSPIRSSLRIALVGLGLLAQVGAQAALTPYFAAQGPKANLSDPVPPALAPAVQAEMASFNAMVKPLGQRQEFESGPSLDFSYTGGTAQFVGNPLPERKDGAVASWGLGRYNTTPGLLDGFGDPLPGHWIEAAADFSIVFSGAPIQALSFLGTDFFDFRGTLSYSVLRSGQLIGEGSIQTSASSQNGNLVFFGLTSTEAFDEIRFDITQTGTANLDVLGFDSFLFGNLIGGPVGVPEPTSLALAGLALCGLALGRRRTRGA